MPVFPSLAHMQAGVPGGGVRQGLESRALLFRPVLVAFYFFFLKLKYNVHIKHSTCIVHEQLEEFLQTQHQIQQ